MRRVCCILLLTLLANSQWGCATARVVMRNQNEGVVAIPVNHDRWPVRHRQKAEALMAQHFPEGYAIEHEEEYVIGQTTRYGEDRSGEMVLFGNSVGVGLGSGRRTGTATTVDQTEYRIYYRRR
jgi:hypothetical protein